MEPILRSAQVLKQEAEDIGFEGKDIVEYVKEQQKLDREERAAWREERKRADEAEEKRRADEIRFAQIEAAKEQAKIEAAKEQAKIEAAKEQAKLEAEKELKIKDVRGCCSATVVVVLDIGNQSVVQRLVPARIRRVHRHQ